MIAYKVDYSYKNKLDLLDAVISLYSITVLEEGLRDKEKTVLREYILYGYSKQTKSNIRLNLNVTAANLNTINYTLQAKGFLEQHPRNKRLKLLNKDLENIKNCFMSKDMDKAYIINFVQQDVQ